MAALTAAAIEEAGWTARVIVSSFQTATLRAVQAADGRLALGALWGFGRRGRSRRWPRRPRRASPPSTPSWRRWTAELVERAHAMGLAVNVWTVNAPDDLRAMVAAGVDTVITDRLGEALVAAAGGPAERPGGHATGAEAGPPEKGLSPGRMAGNGPGPQRWSAMNVVVCVKQIPDPAAPQSLNPGTNTLDRSGKLIMDDSDNYGVEMALQLASGEGDEVTLVSMAPGGETSGLRTGLAMGAAKAILISDDALAGSDALGTARVLAAAIARANPDLVVMATESSDGYTGTLPVQVAELMGLPSVTFAKAIAVDGGSVKVERQTEAGYDEVVCPLPALVTVTAGVVEPRYPSFKGIMAAKSKPVDNLTVADLGIDASLVGAAGRRAGDHRRLRCRSAWSGRDRGGRGRRRGARRGLPREAEGGLRWRSTRCGCWPRRATVGRPRSRWSC